MKAKRILERVAPRRDEGSSARRAGLAHALESVPGWFELDEAWALHESAREASSSGRALVVEIGSYKGRSTIALGLGLKSGTGGGRVIAIDPHEMDPGQFEEFSENIKRAEVADIVEPIRAMSHPARRAVPDQSVSVLFVDGSHEYDDVVQDVRDYETTLKPGAVVAFNDPYWWGVSHALEDTVGRSSSYRDPRWCLNTLFVRYQPGAPRTRRDMFAQKRLNIYLRWGRRWLYVHEKLVAKRWVPLWIKNLQVRLSQVAFSLILPRMR